MTSRKVEVTRQIECEVIGQDRVLGSERVESLYEHQRG